MNVRTIFYLSIFFISFAVSGQTSFPESWAGTYSGDLQIFGVDSTRMQVAMQVAIVPTAKDSVYDWTLTYDFNGKKDVRAYELHVVDKVKGHYKIDEKNTIVLDAYLYTNTLTSFFSLIDSYIIATYTKVDEQLHFEIISGKYEPVATTGNAEFDGEQIPEVHSYLINGRQKAILTKVKE